MTGNIPVRRLKAEDKEILAQMYEEYLLEEYSCTGGIVFGDPISPSLRSLIIQADGEAVGYCSFDGSARAIDTIFVTPEHRGKGLASAVVSYLSVPGLPAVSLKAPLSPGGERLREVHSLEVVGDDEYSLQVQKTVRSRHDKLIFQACGHTKPGRPGRGCKRCYKKEIRKQAKGLFLIFDMVGI